MTDAAAFSRIRQCASQDTHVGRTLFSTKTLNSDEVCNMREKKLGDILDVMLDTSDGKIRYVVLTSGGFLGMGDRLFAIARTALKHDEEHKRSMLDLDVERLREEAGSPKDEWPDMADFTWHSSVDPYYARAHSKS